MNKETNKKLIGIAEQILSTRGCPLFKKQDPTTIHESYNGYTAALGVSILMIGLRPTAAVYYQDTTKDDENKANRRAVLQVIAKMLDADGYTTPFVKEDGSKKVNDEQLVRYILSNDNSLLKNKMLDCAVALKQVIRTYNLG